ncbi:MAG: ATP-dependent ligase, partial [Alphaproteobacteria bacterium]|nr:ATP-dependent ligase [Alphaproteobacteria bacterium]
MRDFARLLDGLSFQPGRNAKLRLIEDYLRLAPDPDRGYALAALTGSLSLPNVKSATLRELGAQQTGDVLFALSYDYVGDLAETLALVWQATKDAPRRNDLSLSAVVEGLQQSSKREALPLLTGWLDQLNANERWALLKLITGSLRVGVSARLAKTAVAAVGNVPIEDVEEIWHGLTPPYAELFAWIDGKTARPDALAALAFRPLMLAHPLDEKELENLDPADFRAEWKWDGIRVQLASDGHTRRLYSRGSEDASNAFPDIVDQMDFSAVLDGELLVAHREADALRIAPFNELQQRLNRKNVTAKMLQDFPAHVRLYDILFEDGEDLRAFPFDARRERLMRWLEKNKRPRFDLSPLIDFSAWDELQILRESARAASIEGLMLKRKDSPYLAGRVKGHWYKWKRDTLTADCVLMYAQRGHGKRSSFYSDFTFGCWRPVNAGEESANRSADGTGRELVPVGKAYSGYTDEELKKLDKFVRDNTIDRFGPVRVLAPKLVVEVEFDAVQLSTRHKSGLAMRFPRFHRIRWDKPVAEADEVEVLRG